MAFESLSEKFQKIFKDLKGHGRLSEADVKVAMREVKMALLEADVNFKVVKEFVKKVEERAVGEEVLNGLNPGQTVIKIVHEEMIALMGGQTEEMALKPASDMTIILLCGLQGAGKTTMAAKLAARFLKNGRRPLLVGLDIYRPAAIEQLKINGEKVGVPVFEMGIDKDPVFIAKQAIAHAKENKNNVVILDTAGRLHVDESMMDELKRIREAVDIYKTILVVDAMTGQDAVTVASSFNEAVSIDGVILTKLDGDTRGGAALSIRAITEKPILFSGIGEKLTDLEPFFPDRMASRILGMGDVLTLIEKAQAEIDEDSAKDMAKRMQKGKFDYNDYLTQMQQMEKMGGLSAIMGALPGMGAMGLGKMKAQMPDEETTNKQLKKIEAMIYSMTKYERSHPDALDLSRKSRIAKGSGIPMQEINRMVKQFNESRKMMKQMGSMMGSKHGRFRLPF